MLAIAMYGLLALSLPSATLATAGGIACYMGTGTVDMSWWFVDGLNGKSVCHSYKFNGVQYYMGGYPMNICQGLADEHPGEITDLKCCAEDLCNREPSQQNLGVTCYIEPAASVQVQLEGVGVGGCMSFTRDGLQYRMASASKEKCEQQAEGDSSMNDVVCCDTDLCNKANLIVERKYDALPPTLTAKVQDHHLARSPMNGFSGASPGFALAAALVAVALVAAAVVAMWLRSGRLGEQDEGSSLLKA